MHQNFFILLPFCIFCISAQRLALERRACITEQILFIPDETDYYEEEVELSLSSGTSMNPDSVTRILQEQCEFEEGFSWVRRRKRLSIVKRAHDLYKKLKKLYKIIEKIEKIDEIVEFIKSLWNRADQVIDYFKSEKMEWLIDETFRTSIQLLMSGEKIPEMILNHPKVLFTLKQRFPFENQELFSIISATDVMCYQREQRSHVIMFVKLRIPKVKKLIVEKCDDIGIMVGNSYQYYNLPDATFKKNGYVYQILLNECFFESINFCKFVTTRRTNCSKENVKQCQLIKNDQQRNFSRELKNGFAVYGAFTQIIARINDLESSWNTSAHVLYHIIPRSGEIFSFGNLELSQETGSKETIIRDCSP
ncbi:SUN domain-containing protein [Caenorhabditis elegans]|uniref:SUN domain-containing protein n=1 Tax=Caenorhabditis elegans TaxID=6239 RepID=Q5FC52_CAEEL|nr:SUN domain-containing protein [Caenorhabditis elegans]CAI46601.3 SUN domain-containing protein [Caenorhabditis elegans]|eukprot:NP_001023807.3 Uncharacterized protein CELE_F15H10.9 [Caenorhabditis elegans]